MSVSDVATDTDAGAQVALVTGGTGGIGSAICRILHTQGLRVISTALPSEQGATTQWQNKLKANGIEIDTVNVDVADYEACQKIIPEIVEQYGRIDVLVNAAGITRDKTIQNMTLEDWELVLKVNLQSAFNICRVVAPIMATQHFGRIVSIASVNGQTGQFGQANYAASKAGLIGFSMALAREFAAKGVTVNCVSPGLVDTDMIKTIPEDILEKIKSSIPMGRLASADEVANVVAFLASKQASYITGENISVNGGAFMSV